MRWKDGDRLFGDGSTSKREVQTSFLEWLLSGILFVIYFTAVFTVAGVTFRNGHWILGVLGIFFPVLWLIGAALPPTAKAILTE
jgi:hypothetical protein